MNPRTLIRRQLILVIFFVATAFRFIALSESPPGWRDDELIEFDIDVRIRDGWRPLYITEAEGHEPLYHYLHAATVALFGENVVGYKWLPLAFSLLTIALAFALARRLFGANVALVAAALMAVSFWPVMYARLGLRHVGVLPWMLGAYWAVGLARALSGTKWRRRTLALGLAGGMCLAAGMMTYFAGRVVPVVVAAFGLYGLLLHRDVFRRAWAAIVLMLVLGLALAAPMFAEINRLLPEGEQRLDVVGPQWVELRKGNLQPALETTVGTLGMFTLKGDPEALYNVEGRPVFDWLTGALFYAGVAISMWKWKRIEHGFALIAFGLGIAPAFVSNPPGSFSHTMAAMPFAYVLAGLGVVRVIESAVSSLTRRMTKDDGRWAFVLRPSSFVLILLIVILNGALTARDYFGTWAGDDYVRFLYHAPIREVARWLNETPNVTDIAVSTHPNYLRLDPLALRLDLTRDDVLARWFDAETTFVQAGRPGLVIGTTLNAYGKGAPDWHICCGASKLVQETSGFAAWTLGTDSYLDRCMPNYTPSIYNDRLSLICPEAWVDLPGVSVPPPGEIWLHLVWRVEQADLPFTIRTFAHLLDADGNIVAQFDGMGAYLPSLHPGDRFVQFVHLPRPDVSKPSALRIGLYDSAANTRLRLPDGRDFVTLEIP